jgi:hypothetical protein
MRQMHYRAQFPQRVHRPGPSRILIRRVAGVRSDGRGDGCQSIR